MKIRYKFSSGRSIIRTNRTLLFVLFMTAVLALSFVLSYSLVSSSQKKENEKITALTAEVERLNAEIEQKNAEIANLKTKLGQ